MLHWVCARMLLMLMMSLVWTNLSVLYIYICLYFSVFSLFSLVCWSICIFVFIRLLFYVLLSLLAVGVLWQNMDCPSPPLRCLIALFLSNQWTTVPPQVRAVCHCKNTRIYNTNVYLLKINQSFRQTLVFYTNSPMQNRVAVWVELSPAKTLGIVTSDSDVILVLLLHM